MSSDSPECPECGEPVGQEASYCMHCYADLTDDDPEIESKVEAVADTDTEWETATSEGPTPDSSITEPTPDSSITEPTPDSSDTDSTPDERATSGKSSSSSETSAPILADDGLIDNTLTVLVGLAGGVIVGFVGTIVLGVATSSAWAVPVGFGVWLLSTAYLVRRTTVQSAVAHSGYAVAIVFLTIPVLALSPAVSVDGGISGRVTTLGGYVFVSVILAAPPAIIGWVASQFVSSED